MKFIDKVHQYLRDIGCSEAEIEGFDSGSVYIAEAILLYAYKDTKRENGEAYHTHSFRVLNAYRDFVGIVPDDYFCLNEDLLLECGIPYKGIQEACVLHDVLSETDLTEEDIAEMYEDLGLKSFFEAYILPTILTLKYDEYTDDAEYVYCIIGSPAASIVKFMELIDDINTIDAEGGSLDDKKSCAIFCKMINDKWHFDEKIKEYFRLKNGEEQ